MPRLHQAVCFESPATEFSPSNDSNFERAECLCGIPECLGHEDNDGVMKIPRLLAQLFLGLDESGSVPLS
jgi:hypothetical protein